MLGNLKNKNKNAIKVLNRLRKIKLLTSIFDFIN
jgi:hypothetical protein